MRPPVYATMDFRIPEQNMSRARAQMRKAERYSREQPGCLQFHFLQDLDDPTLFKGYGIWTSHDAMQLHRERMASLKAQDMALGSMFDPETELRVRIYDRV